MSFVSLGFLIFLLISGIAYYVIPHRYQWTLLLIISYLFYLCSGTKTIGFIIFTTINTYFGGLLLSKVNMKSKMFLAENKATLTSTEKSESKAKTKKKKRLIIAVILFLNFGILAFLKYYDFAVVNITTCLQSWFNVEVGIKTFDLILPLGISFYTFQSMSYIIDVYQGKYEADRNIFKFALFVSYFPQILQGPIGRYNRLSHQFFERHQFELTRIQYGIQLMLWGYFKKMVLADRAGIIVEEVFRYVHLYSGIPVMVGILCYCIQLYADFSGGMDIVMGVSEIFGIKLDDNFRQPFFSRSISEFWHRWHITLGTWMKDYIFYPFSLSKAMNKFGKFSKKVFGNNIGRVLPICLANLLIFFIVGIWHGAAWKFIAYGLYNGFIIAGSNLFEPVYTKMFKITHINNTTKVWKLFQILRTFVLINIGWYFDRAESLYAAWYMFRNTITGFSLTTLTDGSLLNLGLGLQGYLILFVGCFIWFIVSICKERGINVRESIARKPLPIRWAIYLAMVFVIPYFGKVSNVVGGFIYAQF